MPLQSDRFSGDPVLEQCLSGAHRMFAPEANLSVMRVQEALRRLNLDPGELDGTFGDQTGAAVVEFKRANDLSPDDPVVGPGTSGKLDELLFVESDLDPDFGELAPYVAAHRVEPFVGLELAPLLNAPLDSQRHDLGFAMLDNLSTGFLRIIVAVSRALTVPDPVTPPSVLTELANLESRASGVTMPFVDSNGTPHVAIGLNDLLIRGLKFHTHLPDGLRAKAPFRVILCHELTHVRNEGLQLELTPPSDLDSFIDTALAADPPHPENSTTAQVFTQFVSEMNARHVAWIIEQEDAGDPLAAQFLQPAELCQAAHFYFAETDPSLFFDNGYIASIVASPDSGSNTYRQLALWLRRTAELTFSGNQDIQARSVALFREAADAADSFAANLDEDRPVGRGLYPGPADFVIPAE